MSASPSAKTPLPNRLRNLQNPDYGKEVSLSTMPDLAHLYIPEATPVMVTFTPSDDGSHYLFGSPEIGYERVGACDGTDGITSELVEELINVELQRTVEYRLPLTEEDKFLPLDFSGYESASMQLFLGLLENRLTTLLHERVPSFSGRLVLAFNHAPGVSYSEEPEHDQAALSPFRLMPFVVTMSEDGAYPVAGSPAEGFDRITVVGPDTAIGAQTLRGMFSEDWDRATTYPGPFSEGDRLCVMSRALYQQLYPAIFHILGERFTEKLKERVPGFTGRLLFFFVEDVQ